MVPMVLQQMVNLDEKNMSQQPTPVIKRVKKKKTPTIVLDDSLSDSSSDSLSTEVTNNIVEDVPIQRPKRTKAQHQQKSSNTNLITNNLHHNSILKRP